MGKCKNCLKRNDESCPFIECKERTGCKYSLDERTFKLQHVGIDKEMFMLLYATEGYEHDKDKSCEDCPDRSVEPDCHMDCKGYKKRQKRQEKINKARRIENDYRDFKGERVRESIKKSRGE